MPGEHLGRDKLGKTMRRVYPVARLISGVDPWLSTADGPAGRRFPDLIERAGYGAVQSCLSRAGMDPGSGSGHCFFDGNAEARQRPASASDAISRANGAVLAFVVAMVTPGADTVGSLARQRFQGSAVVCMAEARRLLTLTAG